MNESTQAINSSNWMVAAKNTVSYLWLGVEAAKAGKMRFQVICEVPQLPLFSGTCASAAFGKRRNALPSPVFNLLITTKDPLEKVQSSIPY